MQLLKILVRVAVAVARENMIRYFSLRHMRHTGLRNLLQPCSRAARKWGENEEMERKWIENEEMERERKWR